MKLKLYFIITLIVGFIVGCYKPEDKPNEIIQTMKKDCLSDIVISYNEQPTFPMFSGITYTCTIKRMGR